METQVHEPQAATVSDTTRDEPRKSVEQADELVATVAKRLTEVFSDERNRLEQAWDKGAIRRYRSLFEQLLSA